MIGDDNNLFIVDFNSFFHDYEFYGCEVFDTDLYKKAYDFTNKLYDEHKKLYFEMSEDMSNCMEIVSGIKFLNVSDPDCFIKRYYSEELGLYILVPTNYKDYEVNLREMVINVFNKKYIKDVLKFFKMHKEINDYDQELISRAHLITLNRTKNNT